MSARSVEEISGVTPDPEPAPAVPAAWSGLGRKDLRDVVPDDPWQRVRLVLTIMYGIGYIWWFRTEGLIIDRISVAISVAIFLVCAFVGKPWRRWAFLVVDASLYAFMWFCYEMTRGAADKIGFPYQVEAPRNIDRFLFFGTDPNVWLQQRFYHPGNAGIRWYDNLASATYYTHFVFPVVAMAILWASSRLQWVRFMKRFASLLGVACIMFVLMPTVPPWMASSTKYEYRLFAPLARHTGRGFSDLGFKGFVHGWQSALDWGNAVAAMPSLHAGFAMFYVAFFLPWVRPKWLKALLLCFPVMMLTSLVYFGEHWVIDGIIAWLVVGSIYVFWNRMERRSRRVRAERARAALMALPA